MYSLTRSSQPLLNWLTVSLISVIVFLLLAGCAGPSSTQDGKVELTYALWDDVQQPAYQKSIDEFMKLHPNIRVTIQQTPWDQYWQKLDTQLAAGSAPDVYWHDITYFPQHVKQGQVLDITPLIERDKIDTSIYYKTLLDAYSYEGKQYGLPRDWDTIAIFYNKDIFKKMNIEVPDELTWNPTDGGTFLKLLQQLTVDKQGLHPDQPGFNVEEVEQYGFISANSNQELYWNYIAMNGGTFLDKPYGKEFTFNRPESVQALQFLVDLITKWHVSPDASETGNSGDATLSLFGRGRVAMIQTGSWNVSALSQQVNFPFGIIKLPVGPKGRVTVFNGLADSIYTNTPHKEEAWELFKWLASPESQRIIASNGIVWPGIKSVTPVFSDHWKEKGIDVSAFLEEAEGQTITVPLTPAYNEANAKIDEQFNLMYLGQLSVQQAVDKAVQEANAILAQNG